MERKKKIQPSDWIEIRHLKVYCQLGITEEERRIPQEIDISLQLATNLKKAGLSDNLKDTIDYAVVILGIKTLLKNKSFSLIETVGEQIASYILETTPADEVIIEAMKKPFPDVQATGVRIHRKRS